MVIANPESELDELYQAKKKYNFIDFKVKALPLDELYDYLYASDVLLIQGVLPKVSGSSVQQ